MKFKSTIRTLSLTTLALFQGCGAPDANDRRASLSSESNSADADALGLSDSSQLLNSDFSAGLSQWKAWNERGNVQASVVNAQALLRSSNHNGGIFQSVRTGGVGTVIEIDGYWQTSPAVSDYQWSEVLVINSDRVPVDGQDINAGQADVVLLYKNTTFDAKKGWQGKFSEAATVRNNRFVAKGNKFTLILKSGNLGKKDSGVIFDNLTMKTSAVTNSLPVANFSTDRMEGEAPLLVQFDASSSSDPDKDALRFDWKFGDGTTGGNVKALSHAFADAGTYTVTLEVSDGRGGSAKKSVNIVVRKKPTSNPTPDNNNLVVNGDFAQGTGSWLPWKQRGSVRFTPVAGGVQVAGENFNGGIYQQFKTGGAGNKIEISGLWQSAPTVAQGAWAEVLIINGPRNPQDSTDINAGQADVVLAYKADTFKLQSGWQGEMQNAKTQGDGTFVAAGAIATIVLKGGSSVNQTSGVLFRDMTVHQTGEVVTPPQTPPGGETPQPVSVLEWDTRLDQRGVKVIGASVAPGQGYWRLVRGRWYDENEPPYAGQHHIFVDAVDAAKVRKPGVPMRIATSDGSEFITTIRTEAKPGEPYAANFPMFRVAPSYSVRPDDGSPADLVQNLGLGSIVAPAYKIHTSSAFVWQWTVSKQFNRATLKDCKPNAGVTYVNGKVLQGGKGANGHSVVFSYQSDGPIVAKITSGPHSGYPNWDPGFFSHLLQVNGPRQGTWFFWVVNKDNVRISEIAKVVTDGQATATSCQQATIQFDG